MLDKPTIDIVKKLIKEINKEKNINNRVNLLIQHKDEIRYAFNEELDELFSEVDLKPYRQYKEDDFIN